MKNDEFYWRVLAHLSHQPILAAPEKKNSRQYLSHSDLSMSSTCDCRQRFRAKPLSPKLMLDEFLFPDYIPHRKLWEAVRASPSGEGIQVPHE